MKKSLSLFSIIMLLLSNGCSTNSQDSYTYDVYEKDEKYLLANIPYKNVEVTIYFSYSEVASDEMNQKYIKELGLRKYKKYLVDLPYTSNSIYYRFAVNDFKEKDKKFFESLDRSDLVKFLNINYVKQYSTIAKINNEYYGLNENYTIGYSILGEIRIDAGMYLTNEMLENALINKKIETSQILSILDNYPNSFFDENILVVLGTSISNSMSYKHTLYDVQLKNETIYGLVEVSYPDINSLLLGAIKEQTHCISISKDYLESIKQIELLYCPYSRSEIFNS